MNWGSWMLSKKIPKNLCRFKCIKSVLVFHGEALHWKMRVKQRHMTCACCFSVDKSGFTTHRFFFPFSSIEEPYNPVIQKGEKKIIPYIYPQIQHFWCSRPPVDPRFHLLSFIFSLNKLPKHFFLNKPIGNKSSQLLFIWKCLYFIITLEWGWLILINFIII